jgi:hypothetical protein
MSTIVWRRRSTWATPRELEAYRARGGTNSKHIEPEEAPRDSWQEE